MSRIENLPPVSPDRRVLSDIDEAFEAMAADAELVHEFRMSAASEWAVLEPASRFLRDRNARLLRFRVVRGDGAGVSLRLQVAGIRSGEARMLVRLLERGDGVSSVRLEYAMVRSAAGL
ncbi:MAG: hypothetical protein JJ899_15860 [Alphaproteobacteria bacterium]|nr:hypothetical protein [Alphaproteobacteria bacterium]